MGAGDHALVARAGVEWAAVWAGEPRGQVRASRDPRGDDTVVLMGVGVRGKGTGSGPGRGRVRRRGLERRVLGVEGKE